MLKTNRIQEQGFTLIELLMVILVIGVLAAMGISQFVNFGKDAKDSALKANLQLIRRGISAQNGMMRVRCGVTTASFPDVQSIEANDIADGNSTCNTTMIPNTEDRKFVSGDELPNNPWTAAGDDANDVHTDCTLATRAVGATDGGWCYDSATGTFWANTANNGDTPAENLF